MVLVRARGDCAKEENESTVRWVMAEKEGNVLACNARRGEAMGSGTSRRRGAGGEWAVMPWPWPGT